MDYEKYGLSVTAKYNISNIELLTHELITGLLNVPINHKIHEHITATGNIRPGIDLLWTEHNANGYLGLCIESTMFWIVRKHDICIDGRLLFEHTKGDRSQFCKLLYKTLAHELQHLLQFMSQDSREATAKEHEAVILANEMLGLYDNISHTSKQTLVDTYNTICMHAVQCTSAIYMA